VFSAGGQATLSFGVSASSDYAHESPVHGMTGSLVREDSGEDTGVRRRIMVVADGVEMRRLLWRTLTDARFKVAMVSAGADVEAEAAGINPNLVVADVSSPIIDRFALMERARRFTNVPVVLVGHDSGESIAASLRRGADEYVRTPLSPAELVARVEAVFLRRYRMLRSLGSDVYERNGLRVDLRAHGVTVDGREVALTATEFHLLAELVSSPGRVFSTPALLRRVWGESYTETGYLVRSVIRSTRAKLGDDPQHPRFIKTLHGIGYQLVE
jgi:DNA-binding response OmpR family regulator